MAYGDSDATKVAEYRMYTACWGFALISIAAVLVALISMAENVTTNAPFICSTFIIMVGYPCVVLAAWGDSIKDVIDHFFSLFKKKEKE